MKTVQVVWLLIVSAIWGASHSLVKIAVAEWGSSLTTFLRIVIAAVTLTFVLNAMRRSIQFRQNYKEFIVVACLNAAFPIFLFAYAARTLPASYLVILNATTPIWSAIFSSFLLKDPFTLKKGLGIILGISGIVLLEERGTILQVDFESLFAMGCALFACACYGLVAVYLKKSPKKIDPTVLTAGSNMIGAFLLLPFAFQGEWHWTSGAALPAILALGVLGSGLAFVIYYRLLNEVGPFKATLTTFIMPVFGLFWGWLFLDEQPNISMLVGVLLIISATALFLKRPTVV